MPKETQYVIFGYDCNGDIQYWNNNLGWIEDDTEATTFDSEILTAPLPEGGAGFIQYTLDGELVATLDRVSTGEGSNFSEKS